MASTAKNDNCNKKVYAKFYCSNQQLNIKMKEFEIDQNQSLSTNSFFEQLLSQIEQLRQDSNNHFTNLIQNNSISNNSTININLEESEGENGESNENDENNEKDENDESNENNENEQISKKIKN
eukprot:TRINITY_DN6348_c0_g1_i1.p1 TRINITY_DN6348_c0_g1~~TRINITY_DN6348_c0_g1_i1.p1  ORF type:complete len:124 (+),score=62.49 TRINITY_DN6348_c0_g1_i1:37-408(+)